jgi:DNA-binding MarR family transcriptional regulator
MPSATTSDAGGAPRAELAASLEDLLAWARRLVPPGELSLASTALLARLARSGGAGVSALAVAEGVSQPAMSQMVARLERDGLLTRERHPDDGRALVVVLTDAGREVVTLRRAQRARALSALVDAAGPEDAAVLDGATPALVRLGRAAASSSSSIQTSQTSQTTGRTPLS